MAQDAGSAGDADALDEASTIARIRSGDEGAFRALYLRFFAMLLDFVMRYVRDVAQAEDIIHDIFLGIWAGRATWAPAHGLEAYLFGAARNRALNIGRAAGTVARTLDETTRALFPAQTPIDDALITTERELAVRAAVAQLPERAREAVTLRWMHGLSHAKVAAVLGISEEAARKLVSRAAAQLKMLLQDYAP